MTFEEIKEKAYQAYKASTMHMGLSSYTIYNESNEHLCEIFDSINIKNKDVLAVLGSSDQALSCYYNGAKTIDTFDKVYISLWYAYLRKWLILYQNKFYPSHHFFTDGDKDLYDLICKVIPDNQDEADAEMFWKIYLGVHKPKYASDYYLFNPTICSQDKPFSHDIEKIKHYYDNPINFKCLDICGPLNVTKQYDVLILSNIIEHTFSDEERIIVRENIEDLLKEDGIAVCSSLIYDIDTPFHENEIKLLTANDLELLSTHQCYEELMGRNRDIAYVYKKKRH